MVDATENKQLEDFITNNPDASKQEIYDFFDWNFINTEYYTEFVQKTLKNALDVSYNTFEQQSSERKLYYLKSLANLIEVSLSIKFWEFQLSREDANTWWHGVPNYFIYPSELIKSLEELRYNGLRYNPNSTHNVIFAVEGKSEFTFLKYLKENLRYANFNKELYSYNGKGEVVNLSRYINEKSRQGVGVNLVVDMDGNKQRTESFLNNLKQKCTLHKEFIFRKDFENSISAEINTQALSKYISIYAPEKTPLDKKTIQQVLKSNKPFILEIGNLLSISIDKPKLAEIYGEIFAETIRWNWNGIFNDKKPEFSGEIYDFLRFLVSS